MGQLTRLHADNLHFPPADNALEDPPGLLAVGGDLRPERLLAAYRQGIFPWFDDSSPILWWSPDPRMVLKPADVHCSRSLGKLIRRGLYRVTMDSAFDQVIQQCAAHRDGQPGTWITEDMQQAYIKLYHLGYAHSVEVWQEQTLVGGLYGISLGRMFFGESMFSRQPNTSKLAFVALCRQLQQWSFTLIDCQLPTDHLASLGAAPMSRQRFLALLAENRVEDNQYKHWQFDDNCLVA